MFSSLQIDIVMTLTLDNSFLKAYVKEVNEYLVTVHVHFQTCHASFKITCQLFSILTRNVLDNEKCVVKQTGFHVKLRVKVAHTNGFA